MNKYLLLLTALLVGCHSPKPIDPRKVLTNQYPLIEESSCRALSEADSTLLIENINKLRLNMTSSEVVNLLKIRPNTYQPIPSKQRDVLVRWFLMKYNLDCKDDESLSFISFYFTPEEKLLHIVSSNTSQPLNVHKDIPVQIWGLEN